MNRKALVDVLALLLAIRDAAQEAHWTAQGENFYSDHLLYERLYAKLDKPIDRFAEILVGLFGPQAVHAKVRAQSVDRLLQLTVGDHHARLLALEGALLSAIVDALPPADGRALAADPHSLAVTDFLSGLAESRAEAHYLLGRRAAGTGARRNPRASLRAELQRELREAEQRYKERVQGKARRNPARLAHVPPGRLRHELRRRGLYGEVFGVADVRSGEYPVTVCWVEDLRTNQVRRINATLLTAQDFVELRVGPLQARPSGAKPNPRRSL